MPELYTIGHSNRGVDDFVGLLEQHRIEALADIRRHPGSRKFPHFDREALGTVLEAHGIEYRWMESLGGRRKKEKGLLSPNLGLENQSFRNFADYMLTEEFESAARDLTELAERKRTTIMCAEALFWQCHRRLVADQLVAQGWVVKHIFGRGELRPHALTRGAEIHDGRVTYPK
jgi:uncharacterized protein (DUF488 family)